MDKILIDLDIEIHSLKSDFTIPNEELPKQRVDGKLINRAGQHRCTIKYETIQNQGRYGIIQSCKRVHLGQTQNAVIKRPRSPSISLAPEAILQSLCYSCIEKNGLNGSISKPYDLFLFANEVRFSMEYINGLSFKDFIVNHTEDEIINCIIQLCYILFVLEKNLNFDHRDLRIENIWIRPLTNSRKYQIQIGPDANELEFKFQVVLLDFGFACIGNSTRKSVVNLGDNVFSEIDPCPKNGRDMYQFLNSCFEIGIQDKLSKDFVNLLKEWMKPYSVIATTLSYIITYDPKFKLNSLNPIEILRWYFK